jgi:hypothetical protein
MFFGELEDSVGCVVKLAIVAVVIGLLITIGVCIGGPVLSAYTLIKGWSRTRPAIKAGAIVLPLAGVLPIVLSGAEIASASGAADVALIVSLFISMGLLALAYFNMTSESG